jgi:hypothetical protein
VAMPMTGFRRLPFDRLCGCGRHVPGYKKCTAICQSKFICCGGGARDNVYRAVTPVANHMAYLLSSDSELSFQFWQSCLSTSDA